MNEKANKDKRILIRVTAEEEKLLLQKAFLYTDGNLSRWLRKAGIEYANENDDISDRDDCTE